MINTPKGPSAKTATWVFILLFVFGATSAKAQVPKIEWQHAYGGHYDDMAHSIQQTSDGGYIVAGFSSSIEMSGHHGEANDVWILKLGNSGAIQWEKSLGGNSGDDAYAVQQ